MNEIFPQRRIAFDTLDIQHALHEISLSPEDGFYGRLKNPNQELSSRDQQVILTALRYLLGAPKREQKVIGFQRSPIHPQVILALLSTSPYTEAVLSNQAVRKTSEY